MASLIEVLINTLESENSEYEILLKLSKEKTPIIIEGNIDRLREIVAMEQVHTDKIVALEKKRTEAVKDIATVLNKDVKTLTVKTIIGLLKGQDEAQNKLSTAHDKLKRTLNDMVVVNEINRELVQDSLDFIEFNINFLSGISQMPETANYSNKAYNVEGFARPNFDAKN